MRVLTCLCICFFALYCSQVNGSLNHEAFQMSLYNAIGVSNSSSPIYAAELESLLQKLSLGAPISNNNSISVEKCLSTNEYLSINNLNVSTGMSPAEFNALCPILLQQLVMKTCQSNTTTTADNGILGTPAQVWGYGTLSVVVISLLALTGAVLVPFITTAAYRYLLTYLISLGIGSLIADALLHLIPHVLDMEMNGSFTTAYGYLCGVLAAIYFLFLIDSFGQRVFKSKEEDEQLSHGHSHVMDVVAYDSQSKILEMNPNNDITFDNCQQQKPKEKKKIDHRLAFMLVFGDSLHNFADGMAIGAAFQLSLSAGLSTSVAIFCHELPHELGDYAILLAAGYSYKKALFLNLISGILALIGLYIAIPLSTLPFMREIVLSLTAGMFLYIGHYKMMECLFQIKAKNGVFQCFLDSLGILCGYAIMICIAYYEDKIVL